MSRASLRKTGWEVKSLTLLIMWCRFPPRDYQKYLPKKQCLSTLRALLAYTSRNVSGLLFNPLRKNRPDLFNYFMATRGLGQPFLSFAQLNINSLASNFHRRSFEFWNSCSCQNSFLNFSNISTKGSKWGSPGAGFPGIQTLFISLLLCNPGVEGVWRLR